MPAKEFTCFPELPPELRIRIWRHSFERRNVRLQEGYVLDLYRPGTRGPYKLFWPTQTIKPVDCLPVAFVNQESREEILRHYIRLYQSVDAPNLHVSLCHGTALQLPNTIYFNPKLDTPTLPTQFNHINHIYLDHKLQTRPCLLTYLSALFPTYNPLAVQALNEIRCIELDSVWCIFDDRDKEKLLLKSLLAFPNLQRLVIIFDFEGVKRLKEIVEKIFLDPGLGPMVKEWSEWLEGRELPEINLVYVNGYDGLAARRKRLSGGTTGASQCSI